MNVLEHIHHAIISYVEKTFSIAPQTVPYFDISLNCDVDKQQFGDISTNIALVLSKELKTNPRALAQKISNALENKYIEKIDIAGPGFINIFLTQQAFKHLALHLYNGQESFFKLSPDTKKQCYLIEFVSANPTGPLHFGHGRGGIIGDVLGNILRFIGHTVIKEFYINDAGTQIQKLGLSFKIRCQQELGLSIELPEDAYQGSYLIEMAKTAIQKFGKQILDKPENFFAYYAKEHLLAHIEKTLTTYGIHFDVWFSEKTLHESNAIEKAIEVLEKKDYLYRQDDALWFRSTLFGDDKDRVIQKSNGELTYAAADIAYLENKITRGADQLIMILGQDHHSYLIRLKSFMQALNYNPNCLDVILYQLVTLKESGQLVRMSKRTGKIITLEDIIQTVGADVARFFYLNRKAEAHLDFDIELALKHTDENPVYYIQYAYVRINSILNKAQTEASLSYINQNDIEYITPTEYSLLKKITSLQHLLYTISKSYNTHLLAHYTIELAQAFHSYYNTHKVINLDAPQLSRGRLCLMILLQRTLKICFDLLGISAPKQM